MKALARSILLALGTLAAPALAQEAEDTSAQSDEASPLEMRATQVAEVLAGEREPQEVFTQGFLAAVPPAQLDTIGRQLTAQFGAVIGVESLSDPDGTRSAIAIRMERAIARGGIAIDPGNGNRVSELLLQSFDAVDDSPAKIETDLAALPGEVSWYFGPLDGGAAVMEKLPDASMPLGSTFKLYVLAALAEDVAQGRRTWSDVVPLTERSYPSGQMQEWPQGAPVTLHTLATMMISISDNTATDQLIKLLGKARVHEVMRASGHDNPAANDPFLTTREMFILKSRDATALEAWRRRDVAGKVAFLQTDVAHSNPPLERVNAAFADGPVALDIEWFASTADLARLFRHMRRAADPEAFAILGIDPAMPPETRARWAYAGYKGGSEPGVLNLTWLLTDKAGADHLLVLSWRNAEASLDPTALELLAQRILSLPQ